jgi:hypothetical protein
MQYIEFHGVSTTSTDASLYCIESVASSYPNPHPVSCAISVEWAFLF